MAGHHVELVIRRPGLPDRRIVLQPGSMSIGRADDNDIVLSDIGVSRRHAKLHVDEEGVEYEDNGSGNGSMFNGRRLKRQRLNDGDEIVIDPFRLQVLLAAQTDEANLSTASTLKLGGLEDGYARLELVSNHRMDRTVFEIPAEGSITLGRGHNNHVILPEPASSRVNSEIVGHLGQWTVRDRGSSNGTFVNGSRVREQVLRDGDKVKIGTVELKFFCPGGDSTTNFAGSEPHTPTRTRAPMAPPGKPAPGFTAPHVRPADAPARAPAPLNPSAARPHAPRSPSPARPAPSASAPTGMLQNPVNVALGVVGGLTFAGIGLVATIVLGTLLYTSSSARTPAMTPEQTSQVDGLLSDGKKLLAEGKHFDAAAQFYKVLQIDAGNAVAERLGYRACTEIAFAQMRTSLPAPAVPPPSAEVVAAVRALESRPIEPARPRVTPTRSPAAAPAYTPTARAAPDLASAFDRGQSLADNGDPTGAIKQWQSVMALDPDRITPEYYESEAAIRSTKDQLKQDGNKHYQAALTALANKQYPTARQQLELSVAADPFNNAARAKLTEVRESLGAQAQDIYKEARIQEDIDKTSDAIRMYRQVVALVGEKDELGAKAKRRMEALLGR